MCRYLMQMRPSKILSGQKITASSKKWVITLFCQTSWRLHFSHDTICFILNPLWWSTEAKIWTLCHCELNVYYESAKTWMQTVASLANWSIQPQDSSSSWLLVLLINATYNIFMAMGPCSLLKSIWKVHFTMWLCESSNQVNETCLIK